MPVKCEKVGRKSKNGGVFDEKNEEKGGSIFGYVIYIMQYDCADCAN